MTSKLSISLAALAAMGFAGAASADATQSVDVTIDVQSYVEISMPTNDILNTIDGAGNFDGAGMALSVEANDDYELYAQPDDPLLVNGLWRGKAESGTDVIGYWLCMGAGAPPAEGVKNGFNTHCFPYPNTSNPPQTQDTNGNFLSGGLGTQDYYIRATGKATDTPSGDPAAPGIYTGTATIFANLQ